MEFSKVLIAILAIGAIGTVMKGSGMSLSTSSQKLKTDYPAHILEAWNLWKAQHKSGMLYSTVSEESYRLSNFATNYDYIQESNANPKHTFTLGLNKFSDQSTEEFAKIYLGHQSTSVLSMTSLTDQAAEPISDGKDTRVIVDHLKGGLVTPVQDQGQCGSCWAFGTIAGLEGLAAKVTGKLQKFSEQQLVSCWHGSLFPPRIPGLGCNGGNANSAFGGLESTGAEQETDIPYTSGTGDSGTCKYDSSKAVFRNKSYSSVTPFCNSCLRKAVDGQPVTVAIKADPIQHYVSGIYNGSCAGPPNHAVTVTGYGLEAGQKYWTIKNSWGVSFGEAGYFRIERTEKIGFGQCQIAMEAVYPTD